MGVPEITRVIWLTEWVLVSSCCLLPQYLYTYTHTHTKVKFLGVNYLAIHLSDHFCPPDTPWSIHSAWVVYSGQPTNSFVATPPMPEGSNRQRRHDGVQTLAHFSLSGCWSHLHSELHSFINSPVIHTLCSF